jgi:hypothetical protein
VLDWFRRNRRPSQPAAPSLRGAPLVRRDKTYSAGSGYVYVYHYQGWRKVNRGGQPATEYVFDVSASRRPAFSVSVFVSDSVVEQWEQDHGRQLLDSERYAIAKMALRQAFDERPDPGDMQTPVEVSPADAAAILSLLGRD